MWIRSNRGKRSIKYKCQFLKFNFAIFNVYRAWESTRKWGDKWRCFSTWMSHLANESNIDRTLVFGSASLCIIECLYYMLSQFQHNVLHREHNDLTLKPRRKIIILLIWFKVLIIFWEYVLVIILIGAFQFYDTNNLLKWVYTLISKTKSIGQLKIHKIYPITSLQARKHNKYYNINVNT